MKIRLTALSLLFALLTVAFAGQPACAQDAAALLERLQQTYNGEGALRADVTQTMTSPFASGASTFEGTLVAQGDRYRVETEQQTLVTDGAVVWIYNRPRQQVIINEHVDNETAVSPSDFFADFGERFTVASTRTEQQDGQAHHVLTLKPKQADAPVKTLMLWMRARDAVITRLEAVDPNDTTVRFDLSNVRFDESVGAETFTFDPPQEAEVVDLRPQG